MCWVGMGNRGNSTVQFRAVEKRSLQQKRLSTHTIPAQPLGREKKEKEEHDYPSIRVCPPVPSG